jgi:predicted KAP-like P-loop ATPase
MPEIVLDLMLGSAMSGDNAIKTRDADRLGRSGFADQLTAALLTETADEGLVAALVGPWGQGKSSVLNMVKEQLESAHSRTVLTFNPWMFVGQAQLVSVFFEQVAGQLRLKGKAEQALADRLIGYGQALSPLVFVPVAGAWLGRAGAAATALGQARSARKQPDPVEQQRQAIETALSKLSEPIFVFIDDIDRLTAREIRDMLGLVRLTAHFPKIIYLLAFDRAKVERALDQDGLEGGRNYLDKIIELSFDLRLLRRIDDEAERTKIVERLCTTVEGFTGRIRLLRLVGRLPNPDMERLIPAAESDRLFREVCGEIRQASAVQLAGELKLLSLLAVTGQVQ